MALNGDLNGVLNNIVHNVSPVIRLSNGLYTLISKDEIYPDIVDGVNLTGRIDEYCVSTDNNILYFKLLGNWSSNIDTNHYSYINDNNKWEYIEMWT